MKKLLENIEIKYLGEALEVGKTIENGTFRVHRYMDSIRGTDMTNAGKKGKKVRTFSLVDLDYSEIMKNEQNKRWLAKLMLFLSSVPDYDRALQAVKNFAEIVGWKSHMSEREERGIDVPMGKRRIETPTLTVEFSTTDFGVYDKQDNINLPAMIPPVRSEKTAIAKFYKLMSNEVNMKRVERLDFNQMGDFMRKNGVEYHKFMRTY